MKRKNSFYVLLLCITCLLLLLWSYTALNKIVEHDQFKQQLALQHFNSRMVNILFWAIPGAELMAIILLAIPKVRFYGLLLSFLLMVVFTIYVGLAVLGLYENRPCSCGGVLRQMSWTTHFWFNLFFLCLAGLGMWIMRKLKSTTT